MILIEITFWHDGKFDDVSDECSLGSQPLPEPMITKICDAIGMSLEHTV